MWVALSSIWIRSAEVQKSHTDLSTSWNLSSASSVRSSSSASSASTPRSARCRAAALATPRSDSASGFPAEKLCFTKNDDDDDDDLRVLDDLWAEMLVVIHAHHWWLMMHVPFNSLETQQLRIYQHFCLRSQPFSPLASGSSRRKSPAEATGIGMFEHIWNSNMRYRHSTSPPILQGFELK